MLTQPLIPKSENVVLFETGDITPTPVDALVSTFINVAQFFGLLPNTSSSKPSYTPPAAHSSEPSLVIPQEMERDPIRPEPQIIEVVGFSPITTRQPQQIVCVR